MPQLHSQSISETQSELVINWELRINPRAVMLHVGKFVQADMDLETLALSNIKRLLKAILLK